LDIISGKAISCLTIWSQTQKRSVSAW